MQFTNDVTIHSHNDTSTHSHSVSKWYNKPTTLPRNAPKSTPIPPFTKFKSRRWNLRRLSHESLFDSENHTHEGTGTVRRREMARDKAIRTIIHRSPCYQAGVKGRPRWSADLEVLSDRLRFWFWLRLQLFDSFYVLWWIIYRAKVWFW